MTTIDDKLMQLRNWREEMKSALEQKVATLKRERDEMVAAYDDEIGNFESELKALGVGRRDDHPTDIGVKAYNFLLENAGNMYTSQALMSSIRSVGALASVVLRPFIDSDKVKTEGSGRGIRYYVPTAMNDGQA